MPLRTIFETHDFDTSRIDPADLAGQTDVQPFQVMPSFGVSSFAPSSMASSAVTGATVGATAAATAMTLAAATTTAAPSWISTLSDSVIKADMAAADVAGSVSETGMAKLFTDLASELLTKKTTLSASQLADLKMIASDLAVGETASSYVSYITHALIGGNAANATWTGGTASSSSLGNLAVGETAAQLSELTGKWFLGTDLPNSTAIVSGAGTFSVGYHADTAPLYGTSGPVMADINQGRLGDCFLLSSLAAVANESPSAIQSMITSNGNNTYGVRFFVNGAAEYVTVSNSLANGGTIFNSGSDLWAGLVEQAYAQLQAGGVTTGNPGVNYGNSFSTIGNGGCPEYALESITGASTVTDFYSGHSSWSQAVYNASMACTAYTGGLSTAGVLASLVADLAKGCAVVLTSETGATDTAGKITLVADHAMTIYGYDATTGNLEIRNPWGVEKGQTWDTTFETSLATLLAAGDTISASATSTSAAAVAPILVTQTASQTWTAGQKVSLALSSATFIDAQGEGLSYSAHQANCSTLPSWLTFNAATETFSGTAPGSAQSLNLTVMATNSSGLSTSETFAVTVKGSVAPGPALVAETASQTWIAGQAHSVSFAGAFTDPAGLAMTYKVVQTTGPSIASWLTCNSTTQQLTGTPPSTLNGTATVEVVASDSTGHTATDTFSIAFSHGAGAVDLVGNAAASHGTLWAA
jgi:hypothetical protein